jgi:hypothetical protein
MNIEWVIACRYVEVHDNLATMIGAGIDTYWMHQGAGPLQVVLAVRALAMPEELEAGDEHAITNVIRDPTGEQVGEMTAQLEIQADVQRPDWLVGLTLPMIVQFDALQEGTYTIEVGIDGASHALPIHVVHGLPPGSGA